jgi:hypothetical protein
MVVSLLLFASTVLLGFVAARQLLGAQSVWEAISLAPLVACFAIIAGADAVGPLHGRWPTVVGALLLSVLLLAGRRSGSPLAAGGPGEAAEVPETAACEGVALTRHVAAAANPEIPAEPETASVASGREGAIATPSARWRFGLAAILVLVVGYVAYAQAFTLDTDNWIHEPLIAGYTLGIFPPVHPFFPDVEMHGHYGRDLLLGTLLPQGCDPLALVWLLNPILALASCGVLLAIFRRFGDSPSAQLSGLAMPFFGICVGFRVGLADSFDGNNGVVYALAIALFYTMLRVFELLPTRRPPPPAGLWLAAGGMLGVYQIVYETHFGLFLLTGALLLPIALWRSRHRARLLLGVAVTVSLSLGLACSEGGPLTDLFQARTAGAIPVASQAQTNMAQHVSMAFPKKELFCVLATSAEYQRLSPGFRLAPFRQRAPSIEGEGYLSVFSPAFLVTHWLPLFTAPLTLLWLLRRRHWPGLAFWIFAAWAYLVPALVDFGPLYEYEYFRWEFAAGFAFSVPLGLMCGSLLDTAGSGGIARSGRHSVQLTLGRRALLVGLGWLLLVLALWPAEKMVNQAVIEVQKHGWPWQVPPGAWRVGRPELGVSEPDIACAQRLAEQILPGEMALTNLGSEAPAGLWPDSVVSALSGARMAGRAHPPEGERLHAHPNSQRSGLEKALMASGRPDLLWNSGITWLLLDPSSSSLDEALKASPHALLVTEQGAPNGPVRQLWKLAPPPSLAIGRLPSQPPFRSQTLFRSAGGLRPLDRLEDVEWRVGRPYRLQIAAFNGGQQTARLGWLRVTVRDSQGRPASDPLCYLLGANPLPPGSGDLHEVVFVTPLQEGTFTVRGELLTGPDQAAPLFSFPITLSLAQRLSNLKATLAVPGAVPPKSFAPLELRLDSEQALFSQGELDLLTRFRQVGGDYVWELDRLPTPLRLNLAKAGTQQVRWNITAPWRAGDYELELEILDKTTGRRVPLKLASPRLTVTP